MLDAMTLAIELWDAGDGALRARYACTGDAPIALTFWWNRRLVVRAADGTVVAPGPGPTLPCGVAEDWQLLAPGETCERDEPLACTQPAGRPEAIGWSYALSPGTYQVTLVYERPPAHGFTQAEPHPRGFTGRVESNPATLVITAPPAKPGLLSRLLGR